MREAYTEIWPFDEVLLVERDGVRFCPVIEIYFIEAEYIR